MPTEVATKVISKTYTAICKNADADTGVVDILIPLSTDSVDRQGESILPSAFKKRLKAFKAHPVLLSSHDYGELTKQIGEWTSIKVTEEGLVGKPKYYIGKGNAEADWGFFLASIGMASYSVGFIPFDYEEDEAADGDKTPWKTYTDVELLEISQVIVPANRDAAQNMRSVLATKGVAVPKDMENLLSQIADTPIFYTTVDPEVKVEETPARKEARDISQKEIADELDYCLGLVKSGNLNIENRHAATGLAVEIIKMTPEVDYARISGGDMPVSIKETVEEKPDPQLDKLCAIIEIRRQYGLIKIGGK